MLQDEISGRSSEPLGCPWIQVKSSDLTHLYPEYIPSVT